MNSTQTRIFSAESVSSMQETEGDFPQSGHVSQPCTLLLLSKENAAHNACSLIEGFMVQLSLISILGKRQGPGQRHYLYHHCIYGKMVQLIENVFLLLCT